ncbi:MAG TPA: hypothetical protein VJL78_05620, partial [Candidatus Nitrosocosmicus sp.]|nr:hypothetical protein [Candidatus Nitrosocosmicus sp.]
DKYIKKITYICYIVPIILIASNGMSYTLEINYDMSTPNIFDFESEENTIDCILKENSLLLQTTL